MADGQVSEDGQSLICAPLVLYRAADGHVFIAVAPVLGQTLSDTLGPLRDHIEAEVAPPAHHQPSLFAPKVCLLDEEVRCEAGPHERTRRNLPVSLSVASYGQVEAGCLRHDIRVLLKLRIAPEHIAMQATLALLMAAMPQIPHLTHNIALQL